ncbi:endo alpha-1,4 polygalactosaminidase [Dermatophilaceae bacterium Sec6.4]
MAWARNTGLALAVVSGCAGCGVPAVLQPGRSVQQSPQTLVHRTTKAFPEGAVFDYQIGGPYQPAVDVGIVDRDRSQKGVPGRFNICYVNAYQAQPDELQWWRKEHSTLLLRDKAGALVIDKVWNEALLDISTPAKRTQLAKIVGTWFAGCARFGHDAVEPDNLDSYTRSTGLISRGDAIAFAADLAREAHIYQLLVAQKNSSELAPKLRTAGYDFAIVEDCQEFGECAAYTSAYGRKVIEIEYDAKRFATACKMRSGKVSLLLRDVDVVPRGKPGYVNKTC